MSTFGKILTLLAGYVLAFAASFGLITYFYNVPLSFLPGIEYQLYGGIAAAALSVVCGLILVFARPSKASRRQQAEQSDAAAEQLRRQVLAQQDAEAAAQPPVQPAEAPAAEETVEAAVPAEEAPEAAASADGPAEGSAAPQPQEVPDLTQVYQPVREDTAVAMEARVPRVELTSPLGPHPEMVQPAAPQPQPVEDLPQPQPQPAVSGEEIPTVELSVPEDAPAATEDIARPEEEAAPATTEIEIPQPQPQAEDETPAARSDGRLTATQENFIAKSNVSYIDEQGHPQFRVTEDFKTIQDDGEEEGESFEGYDRQAEKEERVSQVLNRIITVLAILLVLILLYMGYVRFFG